VVRAGHTRPKTAPVAKYDDGVKVQADTIAAMRTQAQEANKAIKAEAMYV
jgi:hypothetical protein